MYQYQISLLMTEPYFIDLLFSDYLQKQVDDHPKFVSDVEADNGLTDQERWEGLDHTTEVSEGCRAGNPGKSEMAENNQMRGLRVSVVVWGGGVGMEPGWEVLHWHCWLCLNLHPPQRREHPGFLISCCGHKGKREGWSSETVSSQISKTSVWLLIMLSFAKTMVTPLAWDVAQLSAFKMWLTCFLNFPPQCPIFHPAGHSSLCGLLPSSVPSIPFPASGPGSHPTPPSNAWPTWYLTCWSHFGDSS